MRVMTLDIHTALAAVTRTVSALERNGQATCIVTLRRCCDTDMGDLWDAVTHPERLPRWFAPIEGDLALGGRYQLTGHAGGTITACEAPRQFDITWEFDGSMSWLGLRLAPQAAQRTQLTLHHIVPMNVHWETYGPGATGVGWELALLGLVLHLAEPHTSLDPEAFFAMPETPAFVRGSSSAWGDAHIAAGKNPAQARAAAQRVQAFYTGNGNAPQED